MTLISLARAFRVVRRGGYFIVVRRTGGVCEPLWVGDGTWSLNLLQLYLDSFIWPYIDMIKAL